MNIISDIKKHRQFFVAATVLLFLSMTMNLMGIADTKFFYNGNSGTEALFGNQVICGGGAYGGFLLKAPERKQLEVCDHEKIVPYESSFNLAGRIFGYPYSIASIFVDVNPSMYVKFSQVLSALLVAMVLASFLVWVRINFGNTPAITTLLLMAVSPQLMINSATMITHYNILSFVLLVYSLYFYKLDSSRRYRIYFWIGLSVIFCLKALSGYEYITTYAAMPAAVLGYYLWVKKASAQIYAKELLLVAAFCLIGLIAALGIHVGTLAVQKESVAKATDSISDALTNRTIGDEYSNNGVNPYRDLRWTAPEIYNVITVYIDLEKQEEVRNLKGGDIVYRDKIIDSAVSGINYLMLPVVSIPISLKEPFATYVQSFAFFIIFLIAAWKVRRKWIKGDILQRKVEALYVGLAIAFVGYLSWHVLARNHSLIHPHLNGFTMYIPFALFGYIVIGLLVGSGFQKLKRIIK